ncbi:hypothetical protein Btru_050165 [Bulinus truncatus]|nr:hypothetical protein Btru_050165 [Bulinus truncatus]
MAMDNQNVYNIHECSKISAQNIQLKQKWLYLKRKNVELQKQLEHCKETCQSKPSKPLLKHVSVQTEQKSWKTQQTFQLTKPDKVLSETDMAKTKKVLEMHSHLLQRYDKEVKLNMSYAETISDLNVKLEEIEQKLREEKEKCLRLERELIRIRGKKFECEDPVLRDVLQEKNKLAKENQKLKDELKGLDHNFFDEIEDLKFAFLQSVKLNNGYEKTLHKICSQFGLPVPDPEKILHQKAHR